MKIESNFVVISNYNNCVDWILDYTDNFLIYDRSDDDQFLGNINPRQIKKVPNVGYNIYDILSYIVDFYDWLPDVTVFAKGNIVPRHVSKETFEILCNKKTLTPIDELSRHKERFPICMFSPDGIFMEINNSWYMNVHSGRYFSSYNQFIGFIFQDPIFPRYTKFAVGANYVVPKAHILKYPPVFYRNLRKFVSYAQLPGEAHIAERALYTIWSCNFKVSRNMLREL